MPYWANLTHWIGEVDRYFCAIDTMRGGPDCPE